MLSWLFSRNSRKPAVAGAGAGGAPVSYDEAKAIAASGSAGQKRDLAARPDLPPEFLYFLASDSSPDVRRAVVNNRGTPLQADRILARDDDDFVRCDLARKIGQIMPALSDEENAKVTRIVHEVLETLSKDQLPAVRAIVAEEVKTLDAVPPHVAKALARDTEAIVAAPMLRYSPVLSDDDLLDIVAEGLDSAALVAVAQRDNLAGKVSHAVATTNDSAAVTALLCNRTAAIGGDTLNHIVDVAKDRPEWHEALVDRANLPDATIRRIAGLVGDKLVETLIARNAIGGKAADELRAAVHKRMGGAASVPPPDPKTAETRARVMFDRQHIGEPAILDALRRGDMAFVRHALALQAGVPIAKVETMLASGDSQRVAALAWKANLTADASVKIQKTLAGIPDGELLLPRGDGGYALQSTDLVRCLFQA
ncbi:MAG: DUF2336 domain-containing protein [Magnetospirillum sp. WYHS-4]